jgi:hypothetical protein
VFEKLGMRLVGENPCGFEKNGKLSAKSNDPAAAGEQQSLMKGAYDDSRKIRSGLPHSRHAEALLDLKKKSSIG